MEKDIPTNLQTLENKIVIEYLRPLSCHSDIIENLANCLNKYSDVKSFCPDDKNFKYCFWYVGDSIFAFAVGMQNVYLRLPKEKQQKAELSIATKCDEAGNEWYSFLYNEKLLETWSDYSYEYAKNS